MRTVHLRHLVGTVDAFELDVGAETLRGLPLRFLEAQLPHLFTRHGLLRAEVNSVRIYLEAERVLIVLVTVRCRLELVRHDSGSTTSVLSTGALLVD